MNYKREIYKLRFLHCHCFPLGQTGCKETDDTKGPTFNWQQMHRNTTGAETLLHHLQPSPPPAIKETTPKTWLIWHGLQIITHNYFTPFASLHFENNLRSVCKQIRKSRGGDGLTEKECIPMLMFQGLKFIIFHEA